jgi:hypothetical protein
MPTKVRRRRLVRRTVFLERGGRSIRAILLVPASEKEGSTDPILESAGTYAGEPLWEDWLAQITRSRQRENKATQESNRAAVSDSAA